MKILVGVMHCIENEFEQCLAAIDRQTHPAYDRFVLSQLPNKEAHDRLYGTFSERARDVDLFVKIDADMVLARPTFFQEVVDRFTRESGLQHVQIALDDWFTGRRVMGLHVYRSTHRWVRNAEAHFVDMVDGEATLVNDIDVLAPAGSHCPNPSPFQAFHFGVHKATKVLQQERQDRNLNQSCTHWGHFALLEAHYHRSRDSRLGLAVAGFLHGIRHLYGPAHVDFSNAETRAAFERYRPMPPDELNRALRGLGPYGWSKLPHALRYELASYHGAHARTARDAVRVVTGWMANRYDRYRTDRF